MFHHASNTAIYGGQFVAVQAPGPEDRERDAFRQLEQHVALGALHNSRERHDAPKCLPRTREAVFQEIAEWIRVTSIGKPILWLYGPAGAGKSAIAQSMAEKVYRREIALCQLIATFFFNRSNGERNNASRLIATLAYQMSLSMPQIREFVLKAVIDNPHVFSLNISTQMEKLVIEPLLSAKDACFPDQLPPMLIIIDGLDECQDLQERTEFIRALTELTAKPSFHLTVLCHSRPESDIRTAFNNPKTSQLSARLVLDNKFNPDSDIRIFLQHDFSEIKRVHPLKNQLPRNWPPHHAIEDLVRKSSGQFIYVSTAVKYIASRKHNPIKRLKVVLNVGSGMDSSPFKELDMLYMLVLSSVDKSNHPTLLRIIGMICFSGNYPDVRATPGLIDDVLSLERGETRLLLDDLHSLIEVPEDESDENESDEDKSDEDVLKPFHASFGDFLQDRTRSSEYYIDCAMVEADCTLGRFKLILNNLRLDWDHDSYYLKEHDMNFQGKLTTELFKFFQESPWLSLLETHALPSTEFSTSDFDDSSLETGLMLEFLLFCHMASCRSSRWTTIFNRAFTDITAWLRDCLSRPSSSEHSAIICTFQNELRTTYTQRFNIELFYFDDGFNYTLNQLIVEILLLAQTPSRVRHVNCKQHNLAIFDTLLEGLLIDGIYGYCKDHNSNACWLSYCDSCSENFVELVGSADRAACIDMLLPHFEPKVSFAGMIPGHEARENMAKVKQTITAYKQKPIAEDYDYHFKLEPSIELLQKRYQEIYQSTNRRPSLSDLQVNHFNVFECFDVVAPYWGA